MNRRFLPIFFILILTALITVSCRKAESGTTAPTLTGGALTTAAAMTTTDNAKVTTAAVTTLPTTTAAVTTPRVYVEITQRAEIEYVSPDKALVGFDVETEDTETYNNPTKTSKDDPVKAYFSDPYVMRYDGSYYLYSSGSNNSPIWVHKSDDLINWDVGREAVSTDELPAGVNEGGAMQEICMGAYAPEVIYCNGLFVLVTSPGGMGHYVFTSDSPLGPFKRVSENFGCKIDGNIFIDNDGKWYFYYADSKGILCRPMTSPTNVDTSSSPILTGSIIDEGGGTWTEGSMIVYHDGIYYMTYTGNHTMHNTYRIEYGISYDDPTKFEQAGDKRVFVSTTKDASGIGHSSSVKGPDLDSYYLAYHTRSANGKSKDFNIDRIIFNGEEMIILGPTVARASVPEMPDIYALFDELSDAEKFSGSFTVEDGNIVLGSDARVYAKEELSRDTYTIELTVKSISSGGKAGLIFAYTDDDNYASALFDTSDETLVITFVENGNKTEYKHALVRSFDIPYDFNALQAIQVERTGDVFTFYVNDRELCKKESSLNGTSVGVMTENAAASFGYFGATAATGGRSTKSFYKPIGSQTGYILATHCREWGIETGIREDTKGEYLKVGKNDSFNYPVCSEMNTLYSLAVCYESAEGAVISIFIDGEYIKDITLSPSDKKATAITREIPIGYNNHVITLYIREGSADIYYLNCMFNSSNDSEFVLDFENKYDREVTYSDGTNWKINDGELKALGYSKRLYGSHRSGDYAISVDVRTTSSSYKYGILLRTVNPGEATFINSTSNNSVDTTDDGAKKGANWMQGYYLEFTKEKIVLYKVNYDKTLNGKDVYTVEREMEGKNSNITVICLEATIYIYVNGELVGEYTDPEPYMNGMAGVRCNGLPAVYFDNLRFVPIK